MAGLQGLDRGAAPSAATAKQMLDTIGGRWWNVYIGGPSSLASGWTPELVKDYARHGIKRFMITYAGQQAGGTLTRAQGQKDARQALELARGFGYRGDFPLCLDIEMVTFTREPERMVEYVRAWCAAVRKAGTRPGVYANPAPLQAMAKGAVKADFVWIASWVNHRTVPHDPHAATSMPAHLWAKPGQRAWQYAGEFDGVPCEVLGLNVDINVADPGCLAPPPGTKAATPKREPAHKRPPRRPRQPAAATVESTRLPALVQAFRRLDAQAEQAWQRIEAYGHKRVRRLGPAADDDELELDEIAAILKRMEHQLELLVDLERRELADPSVAETPEPAEATAPAEQPAAVAAATTTASIPFETNGDGAAEAQPAPARRRLAELSDAELGRRIERLDRQLDRARRERIARYARVEKQLVPRMETPRPRPKPRPEREAPAQTVAQVKRVVTPERVRALQRGLNAFTERYLEGVAPLAVDGVRGKETNKRIRAAKFYLGYGEQERTTEVATAFVRRLRHPRSPRFSGPELLARAERRRRRQRAAAKRRATAAIVGTPKQIIDSVVLPIAAQAGIQRSVATNDAANAAHGHTISGSVSDHEGPATRAWAADISNGSSPTPEMDRLAQALATRFKIPWSGAGLRNAVHGGYRFQLIYRTMEGGNHFNHVHFGVRRV
jgi:Domain of unknown function (DUF1906)